MSRTPYIYIEYYNIENDVWEKVKVFRQNKNREFKEVSVWPWNGTHDIFQFLEQDGIYAGYGVQCVLNNSCAEIKDEYETLIENYEESVGFGAAPFAFTYSLADIQIAIDNKPEVKDYEATPENSDDAPLMSNPLIGFLDTVIAYIEIALDSLDQPFSFYRIVGWIT